MKCDRCKQDIPKLSKGSGFAYGVWDGEKLCYACCGEKTKEYMQEHGRVDLYLVGESITGYRDFRPKEVINWPGSLRFPVREWSKGLHFIPNRGYVPRYDVWFSDDLGGKWWGVQRGEWNEIVRCKRVK